MGLVRQKSILHTYISWSNAFYYCYVMFIKSMEEENEKKRKGDIFGDCHGAIPDLEFLI